MADYTHPLCELPPRSPADYPSAATTEVTSTPSPSGSSTVSPTGRMLALRFVGDLGHLFDSQSSFADDGRPFPAKPEWIVDAVNTPVAYKLGTRVRLNVTLTVEPKGQFFTLVGDGGAKHLRFRQDGVLSTGQKQYVFALEADEPLPRTVLNDRGRIRWYAQGNGWRTDLGTSGPHELFTLWDAPIEQSSRGYANRLTLHRARLLTSRRLAGGEHSIDRIARKVQLYLNNTVISTVRWESPDPPYTTGSQYWAILDGNAQSQCFTGSSLMELMLDAIGVPAEQHHLHGATTRKLIEHHLDHGTRLMGQQTRTCKGHDRPETEHLCLLYGQRFQEGQGCCLINKRLYAVFVAGNIVGVPSKGRTAAHGVLLALERHFKPGNPDNAFMVWTRTYTDSTTGKKGSWYCGAPALPGVQGPPNPNVPK